MFSNKGLILLKEITEKRPTKKKRKRKSMITKDVKAFMVVGVGGTGEPIFNLQVLF